MEEIISIHYAEDYSIKEVGNALDSCFDDLGGLQNIIRPKSKVMLKCNLSTNNMPNDAKTTHPNIVIALAEKIAKLGAQCIIADYPDSIATNAIYKIYETTQMLYASNQGNAELNLDYTAFTKEIDGKMTKSVTLMQLINDVDIIINIPKLILDKNFAVKGATDNLFGLIPSEMKEILRNKLFLPKDYNNYLLDIYETIKDKLFLNILDGIVATEIDGTQRIMNVVMASQNPVYLDAGIYKMLGLEPKDYSLFVEASKRNLFKKDNKLNIVGNELSLYKKEDLTLPEKDTEGENCDINIKKRKKLYSSYQERPNVDISKCKGCKRCFSSCPATCIDEGRDENNEIFAKINLDKCINCLRCVRACPYQAIDVIIPSKYKSLHSKLEKRMVQDDKNNS